MSKLWKKLSELFSNKSFTGIDKAGNRYFARTEELDGVMKEKRWVVFKGEQEPTSIPVEWICWLNGQRKTAPTPEEMAELEARRERVRQNVALLKKEEEERKAKVNSSQKAVHTGSDKVDGPNLKSFIQQFPDSSEGEKTEVADSQSTRSRKPIQAEKGTLFQDPRKNTESSEPSGSGESFKPGTWQPPT